MERYTRILVVENETTRKFINQVIAKELYELTTVASYQDVLHTLAQECERADLGKTTLGEQIDVIVLDMSTTQQEMVELLAQIRNNPKTQNIKVITIGTQSGVQEMVDAILAGAADYVVKPFTVNELITRIESQVKRKREDEIRWELEARYEAILAMAEGVIMHDATGRILTCNPSAARLLGISAGWFLRRANLAPGWKFLRQDGTDLPDEEIPYVVTLRTGKLFSNVILGIWKSSNEPVVWISINTRLLSHSGEESPYAVVTSFSDVSEYKPMEDSLRESEEKFRALTIYSPAAIFILQDDKFVYVNPGFEKITGYTREEATQIRALDLIHPSQLAKARERILGRMQGETHPSHDEYLIITRQNDIRWVDISIARIEYQGRMAVMGSGVDITDNKRAETVLRDMRLMANLGVLAAGVAEEVHEPVESAVKAQAALVEHTDQFMQRHLSENSDKECVDDFLHGVIEKEMIVSTKLKVAMDLIHSFQQFARDNATQEKRTINLKEYVREVLLSLKARFKNTQHTITLSCADDIVIHSYPDAFMQILSNLVSNSLTHGFVGIETGRINIDISQKDNTLHVVYRDDGRGMEEIQVQTIFNPFVKKPQGGYGGLGMHIVYSLVTQTLGGQIECSSAPGKGVMFSIQLPV